MSDDIPLQRDEVERELIRIVRDDLFGGSDRPIPLDEPLGPSGVGLDSLGVLQFVTAVEARFGIDLPDDFLAARAALSFGELVDFVAASSPTREPQEAPLAPDLTVPPPHHRMESLHHRLEAHGLPGRLLWKAAQLAWPATRFLFARSQHFIVERSLQGAERVLVEPPPSVTVHEGVPDDADLSGLWPVYVHERHRRHVEQWLREGAWALAAVEGGRVVALDLLTAEGSDEVELRPDRLACWGHSLYEAPDVRGRGIGLALIAHSLRSGYEHGFAVQLALVRDDNTPMLAACTQLLGFRTVGTASRTRLLGATRWSWEFEGSTGRGRRLTL